MNNKVSDNEGQQRHEIIPLELYNKFPFSHRKYPQLLGCGISILLLEKTTSIYGFNVDQPKNQGE